MVLFLKTDLGYTHKQIRTSRLLLPFSFTKLSVSYCSVLCERVKCFHIQGIIKRIVFYNRVLSYTLEPKENIT